MRFHTEQTLDKLDFKSHLVREDILGKFGHFSVFRQKVAEASCELMLYFSEVKRVRNRVKP